MISVKRSSVVGYVGRLGLHIFMVFFCCFLGGQVLQITRVQKEDAGKYTCLAVNEAGEDHMHFELEILGKQHMHIQ